MTETEAGSSDARKLEIADGMYTPFPSFAEWSAATSIDLAVWHRHVELLEERRSILGDIEIEAACKTLIRAAAFDTGAIEGLYRTDFGFTFTVVAHQALAWEKSVEDRSDIALPMFKAQLEAYEYLLDAATSNTTVNEVWIRSLHETLCRAYPFYDVHLPDGSIVPTPLPLGEYKRLPNHVLQPDDTIHAYSPVLDTAPEMERLVNELSSPAFEMAHPCVQAAFAHFALVTVHPFQDGNGRVARALASTYLFRSLSLPLIVLVGHKEEYLASLRQADEGKYQPFGSFVMQRALDGISLVLDSIPSHTSMSVESITDELRRLLTVRDGLSHEELDDRARQLLQEFTSTAILASSEMNLPGGIHIQVSVTQSGHAAPNQRGFRQPTKGGTSMVWLLLSSQSPTQIQISQIIHSYIAVNPHTSPMTFRLLVAETGEYSDFRLDEVHPTLTPTGRWRLNNFVTRVLGTALAEFLDQVKTSLHSLGYDSEFRILEAQYGADTDSESNFADVTEVVQKLIKEGRLDFIVTNANLGGDPSPNQLKRLEVDYQFGDSRQSVVVGEFERISLP